MQWWRQLAAGCPKVGLRLAVHDGRTEQPLDGFALVRKLMANDDRADRAEVREAAIQRRWRAAGVASRHRPLLGHLGSHRLRSDN